MQKITAIEIQKMVRHWLETPAFGYLGSDYGQDIKSMLQKPLSTIEADEFLNKLRQDVPILNVMPEGAVNLYVQDEAPDKRKLIIEIAGQEITVGVQRMITKQDFKQKIIDNISRYPAIQSLYEVNDPRVLQHIDAMATMLAMQSQQLEVAMNEPFQKTRDSTVLADSAMRGIVPKATATRAKIKVVNKGSSALMIESGRNIIDSMGRLWTIQTACSVAANSTGYFEALQQRTEIIKHSIVESTPFYSIEIPKSEEDDYLCSLSVSDSEGAYEYRDRYVNTLSGERVFHVEADDRQAIYCRFGLQDVVGTQPDTGTEITLTIGYCSGHIDVEADSPFSFEYILNEAENDVELSFYSVLVAGQNPIEFAVLRDLSRYPSIYDHNAVFLGEFDFLVRRNFPTLKFLSVWNECLEEEVRGSNIKNINCLFIACVSADETEAVATGTTTAEIDEDDLTATQNKIKQTIKAADDSYRIRFFKPVISPIGITISATVSTSYIASEIKEKIIEVLLAEYGKESASSRRGQNKILYRKIYSLLREKISALSEGDSDLTVEIEDYDTQINKPELWRYVSSSSLDVTVSTSNITTGSWD